LPTAQTQIQDNTVFKFISLHFSKFISLHFSHQALEKEMSEFEVLQEQEFDDKELGSFLSSLFQDCDDDDEEAESNALANSSLESDSRDFTMPDQSYLSSRL